MSRGQMFDKQYTGLGETKTMSPYGRIRSKDCAYAEAIGYTWRELKTAKLDFHGVPFTHVLTPPDSSDDFSHVLEPDTRVPNFSTNLSDAIALANKLGCDIRQERLSVMDKIDLAIGDKK